MGPLRRLHSGCSTREWRKPLDHRLVLDGIFWFARTGAPWRDLPEEFGRWSSIYRQFRRWTLRGLWEDILDALNHAGVAPDKLQMVDIEPVSATGSSEPARVIRAHHHAAGAKGGVRKRLLAVREVASRPRSILRVNSAGLPMRTEITPGQDSDYTGYDLVMADNLPQPAVLVANRGYASDKIREDIESRNPPARNPDAQEPKGAQGCRHDHLHPAQYGRALFQQAEEQPSAGDPLRQKRRQFPRLHRHRLHQAPAPPLVNVT